LLYPIRSRRERGLYASSCIILRTRRHLESGIDVPVLLGDSDLLHKFKPWEHKFGR